MPTRTARPGEVVAAIVAMAVLALLSRFITADPEMAAAMARGIAGPATWPKTMLLGAFVCAAGWGVQSWREVLRQRERTTAAGTPELVEDSPPLLPIALGLTLAVAYAAMIPVVGFPLASVVFLVLWFLVGGIRRPLTLGVVSVVGVVLLLYVFVKLALMPLNRGDGVFNDFSIALFRLLGIY